VVAGVQVELFSEAIAAKAVNAGWQTLDKNAFPEPDAHQIFVQGSLNITM